MKSSWSSPLVSSDTFLANFLNSLPQVESPGATVPTLRVVTAPATPATPITSEPAANINANLRNILIPPGGMPDPWTRQSGRYSQNFRTHARDARREDSLPF